MSKEWGGIFTSQIVNNSPYYIPVFNPNGDFDFAAPGEASNPRFGYDSYLSPYGICYNILDTGPFRRTSVNPDGNPGWNPAHDILDPNRFRFGNYEAENDWSCK